MKINLKDKNVVVTIVIIVLLIIGGIFVTRGGGDEEAVDEGREKVLRDVQILPTVDESVVVTLEADALGQEATLEISGIPAGTELIEYELSYSADVEGKSVPKGVIGTIEVDGEETVSRDITLGTCSSGVCKYDQGVESIKVSLKFEAETGDQLFEGEFEI